MAHGFMAALRLSSQSINEPVHKTEMEYVGGNTNLMRGTVTAVGRSVNASRSSISVEVQVS